MMAIQTRYIGPTTHRGARVKAEVMEQARGSFGTRRSTTVGYHDGPGGVKEAHDRAAKALCIKLGWDGTWVVGDTETGRVYVRLRGGGLNAAEVIKVTEDETAKARVEVSHV